MERTPRPWRNAHDSQHRSGEMPTHQSLSGTSDEDLLQRLVSTHSDRFGDTYWPFFATHVPPHPPPRPLIRDLGCGRGLFRRHLGERFPGARLYGYDVTPAMIAYGEQLSSAGTRPTLLVHDVTAQPLPHAGGSAHLVCMT